MLHLLEDVVLSEECLPHPPVFPERPRLKRRMFRAAQRCTWTRNLLQLLP